MASLLKKVAKISNNKYTHCVKTIATRIFNLPPLHHLDKLLPRDISPGESLSHCDQDCQLVISHLLKLTEQASLEEHLGRRWQMVMHSGFAWNLLNISNTEECLVFTFVWPNLYSSWFTSIEPSSFSEAFLLSINCPSGMTLAFSTLYLRWEGPWWCLLSYSHNVDFPSP